MRPLISLLLVSKTNARVASSGSASKDLAGAGVTTAFVQKGC